MPDDLKRVPVDDADPHTLDMLASRQGCKAGVHQTGSGIGSQQVN